MEPAMANQNELVMRILSELEEAGAENISSTMNTVLDITGTHQDIESFQEALATLIRDGFANIGYAAGTLGKIEAISEEAALATARALPEFLSFNNSQNLWIWDEERPLAEIVATTEGITRAREILDERGFQWWREVK